MNFIDIIKARGFVHQFTDEDGLRALLKTPGQRAYIGFDCTAKSLHIGSLLQIMLLRWWQKCGHTPIVLLGGGTTKIGDPSGKDESRPPLTDAQINDNMASLKQVFSQFLEIKPDSSLRASLRAKRGNPAKKKNLWVWIATELKLLAMTLWERRTPNAISSNAALMVNNDDWLSQLSLPVFLRDYGKIFSVNRMLSMDSVKLRLERHQHLSFLEFNYMLFQAYDFLELYKLYGCQVQMGGSDQWGNIVMGVDLVKDVKKTAVFGITSPLLTTATGAKMGKTAAGAVWLNADLLAPYDYWQFWRNTDDADVIRFLKLFTEMPLTEAERGATNARGGRIWDDSLESLAAKGMFDGAAINEAKIMLATEATALLHGRDEAARAEQTARETFAGSGVSENLPEIFVEAAALEAGIGLAALLVQAGFAASNGEARRLIKGNGVSVNDAKVSKEDLKLHAGDVTAGGFIKLSAGKKRHVLVKPNA